MQTLTHAHNATGLVTVPSAGGVPASAASQRSCQAAHVGYSHGARMGSTGVWAWVWIMVCRYGYVGVGVGVGMCVLSGCPFLETARRHAWVLILVCGCGVCEAAFLGNMQWALLGGTGARV
eukprot:1150819-Pelagomonas_calceolata.AAC.3